MFKILFNSEFFLPYNNILKSMWNGYRSWSWYCIMRSLMRNGLNSSVYWTALSSGKPFEWKEMRQSQTGHCSTGSFRITFSSNTSVSMCLKRVRRSSISCIGRELDFFAMAQTPTMTLRSSSSSSKSFSSSLDFSYSTEHTPSKKSIQTSILSTPSTYYHLFNNMRCWVRKVGVYYFGFSHFFKTEQHQGRSKSWFIHTKNKWILAVAQTNTQQFNYWGIKTFFCLGKK